MDERDLKKGKKWQKEMEQLQAIILDCQLTEELKLYLSEQQYRFNPWI